MLEADPTAPSGAALPAILPSIQEEAQDRKQDDEVGDAVFARKYARMNAEARQEALESLRALLEGGAGGRPGDDQDLTEERTLELKREVEWLVNHGSP